MGVGQLGWAQMGWARSLRDQCKEAGVPFFMKQIDKKTEIPNDLMVRKWPADIDAADSE